MLLSHVCMWDTLRSDENVARAPELNGIEVTGLMPYVCRDGRHRLGRHMFGMVMICLSAWLSLAIPYVVATVVDD